MKPLFADTSFFVAFLNAKDENHELAVEHMASSPERIVTTVWVLVELGNYLSKAEQRRLFGPFLQELRRERMMFIIPLKYEQFERGVRLYDQRPDKQWSLVDCISFVIMKQRRISDALSADHHFEQAGFTILLKKP